MLETNYNEATVKGGKTKTIFCEKVKNQLPDFPPNLFKNNNNRTKTTI
jgi:hypothetical protein